MENKTKNLEFIQSTISSMNQNSFQIKGWMIKLVLDAYYLQQERRFQGIYNDVAGLTSEDSRISVKEFEIPIQKYQCGKYCYFNVLFSCTISHYVVLFLLGLSYH